MASWTDNPSILGNFNPYVNTLPAESLAQVGMIKQEQFDQGVQKVQGYVDSLAGLPIAKGEVKDYVQTKLGQLKDNVTKNLAGDFSDARVVNQIGGAAKTIARDPIVQNGVSSTARMQSAIGEMQDAKKAGKSSTQNEAYLNAGISSWINDGQLDSSYNGSYVPYVDITDRFIKLYKEQNPGEDIPNDAFRKDENGQTVVNPVLFKGKSPEKIQALFDVVAGQADVQAQLHVDGWYKYQGTTQNELGQHLAEGANETLANIEKAATAIQSKIAMGDPDKSLAPQLEELKQQAANRTKSYNSIANLLVRNPEAAKTELAKEELASNLIRAYSFQTMEKSPLWETSMQQRVFDREFYEWKQTYDQNERKFDFEKLKFSEEYKLKLAKAKQDAGGGGNDIITQGQITTAEVPTGSAAAYKDLDDMSDQYGQAIFKVVGGISGNGADSPVMLDNVTNRWKYNFGPGKKYKTLDEASAAVADTLADAKDGYMNGKITNSSTIADMENLTNKGDNYKSQVDKVTGIENTFKPQIAKIKAAFNNEDLASAYIVLKGLPGWKNELGKLESKYGSGVDPETGAPMWKFGLGISSRGEPEGITAKINEKSGPKFSEYDKGASKLSGDQSIALALQERENDFNASRNTLIPYTITHDVSKAEDRNYVNTRFLALANAEAVNPSTGKGDAAGILKLTGLSPEKRSGLQYQSGINTDTGKAWINVIDGTSNHYMEISRDEYERQFPERQYNNQFRDKFGARLSLTRWQSTDNLGESKGGGRANAYVAKMDDKDFPLAVQYHVVVLGPNQYAIKLWVTPKSGDNPKPIINGEYANGSLMGMPDVLSEEEVTKWTEKLGDSTWLKNALLYKLKPNTP